MHIADIFELWFTELMLIWEIRNYEDDQISSPNTFAY